MDSWTASDTDALQLDTRFSAPGGSALPIRVMSVIRGWISLRGERGNDFFEARVAAQRVPPRQQFQLAIAEQAWGADGDGKLFAGEIVVTNPRSDSSQTHD